MESVLKKHILDTFCKKLEQNFEQHCHKIDRPTSLENFTTYIVDRGFVQNSTILRYAILNTYEEIRVDSKLSKTELVDILAERFELTSRSIWNALRAGK